jgi:hypothetical protein
MSRQTHGDPRRPDGDLVSGVEPHDDRVASRPGQFGPKVGWGHDAVYRPEAPSEEDASEGQASGSMPEDFLPPSEDTMLR